MRTGVALRFEMPAQIFTLKGCLPRGLSLPGVPSFLKHTFPCRSNQIVLSSVKMTLSKSSLSSKHCCANARRATRFASRTIWQYRGPDFLHPSFFLARLIVAMDKWTPSSLYRYCIIPIGISSLFINHSSCLSHHLMPTSFSWVYLVLVVFSRC